MKTKIAVLAFGVIILTTLLKAGMFYLNHPITGTIHFGQEKPTSEFSMNVTPQLQRGSYATFTYPAGLTLRRAEPQPASIKQQFTYVGPDIESWVLSTEVAMLPNGDLNNNSAYSIRKHNPGTYKEERMDINGLPIIVMTDNSAPGFSETAFIQKNDLVGTVSLTGNDSSGTGLLSAVFAATVRSWKWQ